MTQVGIIGAGSVGEALASRLIEAGKRVKVANSRGRSSLGEFAKRTLADIVDVEDIGHAVDVLVVAVPMGRIHQLPKTIFEILPSTVPVVDAGNYYPRRDGAIPAIDDGMPESVWVARQFGIPVIKAFNNIIASRLLSEGRSPPGAGRRRRVALPVAGDDHDMRVKIMLLVERLGFGAFDAGSLAGSWRQQPGQPAYCTDPTRDELASLLERANKASARRAVDRSERILERLGPGYPAETLVTVSRLLAGLDRTKPTSWLALTRLGLSLLRSGR